MFQTPTMPVIESRPKTAHIEDSKSHPSKNQALTRSPVKVDCNPAELLELISFQMKVQPNVHPHQMWKRGGFIIKGLRGTFPRNLQSLGHRLLWNEKLGFGACVCGWKAKEEWNEYMTKAQHEMHVRLATQRKSI